MKVIVVEINYDAHNKVPNCSFNLSKEPIIFMKPDSAVLKDGKPFFIPDFSSQIEYGVQVVAKICRLGKSIPERFAYRYFNELTIGVDIRASDVQRQLQTQGLPWEVASGFDSSAIIGDFIPKENVGDLDNICFHLEVDKVQKQIGYTSDMLFSINHIISYVSRYYTLKIGDLIYTGIPGEMTQACINQHIQGYLNEDKLLDFNIR